jgi:hypothetical protein
MGKTASLASLGSIADTSLGFRNRIINGAMVIDQRNAGASVSTSSGASIYTIDRWKLSYSQVSKITAQQNAGSVTPPVGFSNYIGITSTSAYSVLSSDYFALVQSIEGFNTADLNWGTANAKTITLSFQVYSSLTGTFGGSITNAAFTRSYPFTYTVSSANTWTPISITITGDTTGTWIGATNGVGLNVLFGLGVGSTYSGTAGAWAGTNYNSATGATSVVGTNGATFYITGVQLEAGSVASPFERRDYGRELIMCQRYFVSFGGDSAYQRFANCINASTAGAYGIVSLPVQMRSSPSLGYSNVSHFGLYNSAVAGVTSLALDQGSVLTPSVNVGTASGAVTQYYYTQLLASNSTSARLTFSAEL